MEPIPAASQAPAPQPVAVSSHSSSKLFITLGVIVAIVLVGAGAYYLGMTTAQPEVQQVATAPEQITTQPVAQSTPAPTTDPTAEWKIYTLKSLGLTYKLPPELTSQGDLKEFTQPGQKGTQISVSIENSKVGSDNFFLMGTTSTNYMAGRGGMFIDLQGFKKENGKYYAKFVDNNKFDIPNDLVSEVTNPNSLEMIKIKGQNFETGEEQGLPLAGTPGKGHIGALININKPPYQGLAIEMILSPELTEKLFDQILQTFKFTQ
jgi:hypothetical protein